MNIFIYILIFDIHFPFISTTNSIRQGAMSAWSTCYLQSFNFCSSPFKTSAFIGRTIFHIILNMEQDIFLTIAEYNSNSIDLFKFAYGNKKIALYKKNCIFFFSNRRVLSSYDIRIRNNVFFLSVEYRFNQIW